MFNFAASSRASSVQIDWSFYGGAEELPPSHVEAYKAAERGDTGDRRPASSKLPVAPSRSLSAMSSSSSSRAATSSSDDEGDSRASDRQSSPPTSSDEAADGDKASTPPTKAKDGRPWLPTISPLPTSDFLWLHTEEPHRTRRSAILAAHPEIKNLMGHEPLTKWISLSVLLLQLSLAYLLPHVLGWHPLSWKFLLTAYAIGGTANQNTFLAIHEITHNLAFKGIRMNKAWAILVNAAIGVPYAMLFKPYHIEHHKHLGEDGVDTDLPTRFELLCLNNVFGKAFFATFQIFFYALRPGFVKAQKPNLWVASNFLFVLGLDVLIVRYLGWPSLLYLLFSSFFAGSLHPTAAHFIAEHYMFNGVQQETWSYYGPLNVLAYNVGYHNEHHDFPSIPWTRLPLLRAAAPEFYDCLPRHVSWPLVTLQFVLGRDSGIFARVKRRGKGMRGGEGEQGSRVKVE